MYKFGQEELKAIAKVLEAGWLFRYGGEKTSLRQVEQSAALLYPRFTINFGLNKAMKLGMMSSAPSMLRSRMIASSRPIRA